MLTERSFSDISFLTYQKHQTFILSENQFKWFSRSQKTLGKLLVYIVYCYNAGVCALFSHILFVKSGPECAISLPIFLRLYLLWILSLRLNYYLSYITTKAESIYQWTFLQKIIKFFNLKQQQSSRGNIMLTVPKT